MSIHPRRPAACLVALLGATSAAATTTPDLETLIVTASRATLPAPAVASSVTVIDAEAIAAGESAFLADLLRGTPGVSVNRSAGPGGLTQLRVRGAEADQVLVLVDGVEANDIAVGGQFNFTHLLAVGTERVELVRGAQSSIWGADALAGVINVVTAKGEGPPAATAFYSAGSFATRDFGGSAGTGDARYNVAVHGRRLDSGGTNSARRGSEDDGYENGTVALRAGLTPLPGVSLDVVLRHIDARFEYDPTPFPAFIPADGDQATEVAQTFARATAAFELFDGAWKHAWTVALARSDNDNFTRGREESSSVGEKLKFEYLSDVTFVTPAIGAAHGLSFVLEHEQEDFTQRGAVTAFGNPNQDQDAGNRGYALEYRLALRERLYVSAAVRRDVNELFADATTWRANASWLASATTRLRASYGTGAKNPTFTERFGFTPDTFFGNPALEPETSTAWEFGVTQTLAQERIAIGVSYFDERLRNEINGFVFDPALGAFGGFTAVNVDGHSERNGVEATVRVEPIAPLRLAVSYTWLDATEPDATGGQAREIRRPQHSAGINLDYRFAGDRARVHAGVHYSGVQDDFDFAAFPAARVRLDDYVLVSAAARYRLSPRLALFARGENLLGQDYEEVFGFPAAGRAGYLGVEVSLGGGGQR
ncbi:MAG: TonB-dependent receptor [Gammaproteobacteria bacterium]|nr:TonB-dependent receptor [Gammaproteobacteria bacterium]